MSAVLIRPLPYATRRSPGGCLERHGADLVEAQQTAGLYLTFKRFAHTIEGIGLYQTGSGNVTDPAALADPARMTAAWTTANTIPLLEVPPIRGRSFSARRIDRHAHVQPDHPRLPAKRAARVNPIEALRSD
jgi:hypothetical protein